MRLGALSAPGEGKVMAKAGRKVELFEILAARKARGKEVFSAPPEAIANKPSPSPLAPRPLAGGYSAAHEIAFSRDGAFVIFVAILAFVGSAYLLGYQAGQREARQRPAGGAVALERRDDVEVWQGIEGRPIVSSLVLSGEEFTLKLRTIDRKSESELARLRAERAYLQALPFLKEEKLEAYIFEKGDVCTLAVGIFAKRDDPRLARLQEYFTRHRGPAISRSLQPYAGCSVTQTNLLGTFMP